MCLANYSRLYLSGNSGDVALMQASLYTDMQCLNHFKRSFSRAHLGNAMITEIPCGIGNIDTSQTGTK